MPSYKLTYFNVRARGELPRYLFAAAGQKFEDCRVTGETWPTLKPNTLFGQLPELQVDGKQLAQGYAIARFLAREFGFAGANSWEEALCDQFLQLGEDLVTEIIKAVFEKDEAKKQELMKAMEDTVLPKFMGLFEKALEKNGGTFLVGKKLSVADLGVLAVFDTPMNKHPNAMDKFPKLKAHRNMVLAVPAISNYVKNRTHTDL